MPPYFTNTTKIIIIIMFKWTSDSQQSDGDVLISFITKEKTNTTHNEYNTVKRQLTIGKIHL